MQKVRYLKILPKSTNSKRAKVCKKKPQTEVARAARARQRSRNKGRKRAVAMGEVPYYQADPYHVNNREFLKPSTSRGTYEEEREAARRASGRKRQ